MHKVNGEGLAIILTGSGYHDITVIIIKLENGLLIVAHCGINNLELI